MGKKKRGRPSIPYDPKIAEQIRAFVAEGSTQKDIAGEIGMDVKTMCKLYREELTKGTAKVNRQVAGKLLKLALSGNLAALIFWAKTRMGWSEKASFIGREILEQYEAKEITLLEAALSLEKNGLPLPETIRILLMKEQPEPEDTSKGQYIILTDEEMEERVRIRRAEIEAQRAALPERQAEIRELRAQIANQFEGKNE